MKKEFPEKACAENAGRDDCGTLREVVLSLPDVRYISAGVRDTVLEALAAMEESGFDSLVVLDRGRVAGVLTARDCAFRLLLEGKDPGKTKCRDVMRRNPFCADANMCVGDCLALMVEGGIEHAVVIFGGYPVGCVTADLLLRARTGGGPTVPDRFEISSPAAAKP